MTITSVACVVGPTGISSPSLADILSFLQSQYQAIYGSDVVLTADTQDGQWLGIQAQAFFDCNQVAVFVYNQFSPATSQGAGLSSVVKINGIAREVASNSTCNVTLTGQAGTIITAGAVGDNLGLGTQWALPPSVTIPEGGSITVTATCTVAGSTAAAANTLTVMLTPTANWQSVTNATNASPGNPVESDATLRQRQGLSTAAPSLTVLDGIIGAIESIVNVTAVQPYENTSSTTDSNGIPGHSICLVVQGGAAQAIANAIGAKKTPGTGTYGNTSAIYTDPYGLAKTLYFSVPTQKTILVAITVKALTGYTSTIGNEIKTALANYIIALGIGQSVMLTRLYVPAQLLGPYGLAAAQYPTDGSTYEVTALTIAISPASPGSADLVLAFDQIAVCTPSNITLTVV